MKKAQGGIIYVLLLFFVIIFLFGIFNIVSYSIQTSVDDLILADLDLNESKEVITDTTTRLPSVFDGLAIFILVGLWIGGIVFGIMNEEHPVLFGFMILVSVAVLISGMFLANGFEDFTNDSDFSTVAASFPATTFIISHLLEVGIMMVLSVVVAAVS